MHTEPYIKYDNETLYGIHDKAARDLLSLYSSTIFLSSLIGDVLILIGTLRYNAIKLHKVMVVIMQYIALTDLMFVIFRALPGSVSLVAERWIFGDFLCYAGYALTCAAGGLTCLLISTLTLTKLLIVKFPLRAISISTRVAHVTTLSLGLYCLTAPVLEIIVDKKSVYFNYIDYNCDVGLSRHYTAGSVICTVLVGLSGLLATIVTVVSSVMLVDVARKMTERGPGQLQWQGLITVLLTVAVYSIATLPGTIYFIGSGLVSESQVELFKFWNIYLYRFSTNMIFLNFISNFYIYTLTLTSFREFLRARVKFLLSSLLRYCSLTGSTDERVGENGERRRLLV